MNEASDVVFSLFAFGRSGLRPSLLRGDSPRNAPLQKPALTDIASYSQQCGPTNVAASIRLHNQTIWMAGAMKGWGSLTFPMNGHRKSKSPGCLRAVPTLVPPILGANTAAWAAAV